jgi:hypothetical protein
LTVRVYGPESIDSGMDWFLKASSIRGFLEQEECGSADVRVSFEYGGVDIIQQYICARVQVEKACGFFSFSPKNEQHHTDSPGGKHRQGEGLRGSGSSASQIQDVL